MCMAAVKTISAAISSTAIQGALCIHSLFDVFHSYTYSRDKAESCPHMMICPPALAFSPFRLELALAVPDIVLFL